MSNSWTGLLISGVVCVLLIIGLNKCEKMENSKDETHMDQRGTWKRICVEGHVALIKNSGYNGYALNKLDDTGRPVKCER